MRSRCFPGVTKRPSSARPRARTALLTTGLLLLFAGFPAAVDGQGWTQFRGPERTGISPETGLLTEWPEAGPPILWKRPLGEGFAGISIQGDRLLTLFAEGEKEFLVALATADGSELWRTELGGLFREPFGNGPRSTPTLDGDRVFAVGALGNLVSVSLANGEIGWSRDLHADYTIQDPQTLYSMAPTPPGPQLPAFGYASSILRFDDLLVIQTGAGHGRSFVALDAATGEERWTALDTEMGYSSPSLVEIAGQRQILTIAGGDVCGLSPEGQQLWCHPWHQTNAQPLVVPPDRVLAYTADDVGAMLLRIVPEGDGFTTEELWRSRHLKPAFSSALVLGDHIYGFDNSTLRSLKIADGSRAWAKRGIGQGTMIYADGRMIALSDRGKVHVGHLDPEGYHELGAVQVLDGRCWTPPSLEGGVLYLRNHKEIAAVDLRAAP